MNSEEEPITELAALAAQQHELYEAWVAAGFSSAQSLELLKVIIATLYRGAMD